MNRGTAGFTIVCVMHPAFLNELDPATGCVGAPLEVVPYH